MLDILNIKTKYHLSMKGKNIIDTLKTLQFLMI